MQRMKAEHISNRACGLYLSQTVCLPDALPQTESQLYLFFEYIKSTVNTHLPDITNPLE